MTTPTVNHDQPVQFDPYKHSYTSGGKRYVSATQIVEQFTEEFDAEERSEYMAWRYGNTPEYWKQKWRSGNQESLVRGSKLHTNKEREMYRKGFIQLNFTPHRLPFPVLHPTTISYHALPDGIYPEIMLWRHDFKIAGKSDKVLIYSETSPVAMDYGARYADVEDYKTNKAIRMHGWQNKDGSFRKMLAPLTHLDDCEFNDYALQLSIYQFMLEYFGFKPGRRRIIHFPHKIEGFDRAPKPVPYELPYLRDEVIAMLNHLNTAA